MAGLEDRKQMSPEEKLKQLQEYEERHADDLLQDLQDFYLKDIDSRPQGKRIRAIVESGIGTYFLSDLHSVCEVVARIPIGNNAKKKYTINMFTDEPIGRGVELLATIYNVVDVTEEIVANVSSVEDGEIRQMLLSFGPSLPERMCQLHGEIENLAKEIEDKTAKRIKLKEEREWLRIKNSDFNDSITLEKRKSK
jgi:hypothetical protein